VDRRHLTTAVTLLVLVGILVAGVVLGVNALFAPLPEDGAASATPSPTCSPTAVERGQTVRSSQVQVSIFNGGGQSGLADGTMRALIRRGFTEGDIGNAPDGVTAERARVLTTERNDTAARLVARQFGRATKITVTDRDLGPGVDVVIGDQFEELVPARKVIVARASTSVCVPVPTETPAELG